MSGTSKNLNDSSRSIDQVVNLTNILELTIKFRTSSAKSSLVLELLNASMRIFWSGSVITDVFRLSKKMKNSQANSMKNRMLMEKETFSSIFITQIF